MGLSSIVGPSGLVNPKRKQNTQRRSCVFSVICCVDSALCQALNLSKLCFLIYKSGDRKSASGRIYSRDMIFVKGLIWCLVRCITVFPVLFPGHETMLGFCSFDSVVRVAEGVLVRSSRILDPRAIFSE